MPTKYLRVEHVVSLHDMNIEKFGGALGLRDGRLLESAVSQPQQSFGGQDLYPSLFDKAAAYAFFISENQPFLDGNKRTAISAASVFLAINGHEVIAPEGALYETIMQVANKQISREGLAGWFRKNSRRRRNLKNENKH